MNGNIAAFLDQPLTLGGKKPINKHSYIFVFVIGAIDGIKLGHHWICTASDIFGIRRILTGSV